MRLSNLPKIFVCIIMFLCSLQTIAAECRAVFPDVISTHGNGVGNSQVDFGFNASLVNNPDALLSTRQVSHNGGSTINSCDSENCSANGVSAETVSVDFQRNTSREDINVPFQNSVTLRANDYDEISTAFEATLTFSDSFDIYYIDGLTLGSSSTVNFSAGGTYYINKFSVGSGTRINITGNGTAKIYINSSFRFNSPTIINSSGVNQAGDASKLVMHVNGNVELGNQTTFTGALYARNINFESASYLFGVASGNAVNLRTNSILTYDNNVFNSNFGELCSLPAAPIANFKFDEVEYTGAAGEVIDSIGTFHSSASVAQPMEGKVCNAVDLSSTGISDYVILDKDILDNKQEFSISLWAKTLKSGAQSFVSGAGSGSHNELIMWFTRDTSFRPHLQDQSVGSITNSTFANDDWHHLVWTHANNQSCLFIDKALQGCLSQTTSTLDIDSLILGQEQDSVGNSFDASQAFNGLIDELVIFDQAIEQSQIDQIYDFQNAGQDLDGSNIECPIKPPEVFADPIANYKFDELEYTGIEGEVIDSVGSFHSNSQFSQPVDGKVCRAIDLSEPGIDDYVTIDKDVLHDKREFSISLWEKTLKTSNQSLLSGANATSNNELIMWFRSDQRFTPFLQNRASSELPISSIAGDTWRHLVWTHGNNRSCLFINKVAQGCVTQATATLDIESLILGQEQDNVGGGFSSTQAFEGLIDELIIYDEVIGQGQIDQIYDLQNQGLGLDGEPVFCAGELIAQFSMEEAEWPTNLGGVADETGNFNATAVAGPITLDALSAIEGNPGTCRYGSFDGVDDYIELPNTFENLQDSFTITAWINPSNVNSGSRIFIDDESDSRGFGFSLGDPGNGKLRFFSRGVSPISVDTTTSITPNTWTFVTAVHDSQLKTRQIYINGVAQNLNTGGTSSTYTGDWGVDNGPVSIGGETANSRETGSRFHFTGDIDEVSVYKGALTQTEIEVIRDQTHPCIEPVIHHYEITHDGNGLTCAVEPITIKACTNSDCSSLSTEAISLDFNVTGTSSGLNTKASPTFIGSTSFTFNHTTEETLVLSIDGASIAASDTVECKGVGTSCNMEFDGAGFILSLEDHNSCTTPNLVIQAVRLSDNGVSCAPVYMGNQPVDFTFSYDSPVTGTLVPTLSTVDLAASGVSQRRTVNFDVNASAMLPFQYNDAGRVQVSVSDASALNLASGSVTSIVSPTQLVVKASEISSACISADPNDAACSKFKVAGEVFNMEVGGVCGDGSTVTPNFKLDGVALTHSLVEPENMHLGNLSNTNVDITENGVVEITDQAISEVGVFKITATAPLNGYFGKTISPATSENIGRFIPSHFTVEAVFDGKLSNINGHGFSYTGEMNHNLLSNGAIIYENMLEPEIMVSARNQSNELTQNYVGNFMRIVDSSITLVSPIEDSSQLGRDTLTNTNLISQVDVLGANIIDKGDGTVGYTFSNTDNFVYVKNENAQINEYISSITLNVASIIDEDDVEAQYINDDSDMGVINLMPEGLMIRFGRWNIQNTYGPETANLPLHMEVQYWNGNAFIVNTLDSLTTYNGDEIANYTKNNTGLSPALATNVVDVSGAGPQFRAGLGQLLLTQPIDGSRGQIRVTYESVPAWLKFNWNGIDEGSDSNIFDDNPSGVATFGIYRGNDRIISWREVGN